MTALIIILSVFAFLFLLLLIPAKLKIKSDGENLKIYASYLFLKWHIRPPKPKKPKNQKPADGDAKQTSEKAKTESKNYIRDLFKNKGAAEALQELFALLKAILDKLGAAAKHIIAEKFVLKVVVGGDNAAAAAICYGAANAVLYPALSALDSIIIIKNRDVDISCDFDRKQCSIVADIRLSVKPLFVLNAACGVLIKLIKTKAKEGVKNG